MVRRFAVRDRGVCWACHWSPGRWKLERSSGLGAHPKPPSLAAVAAVAGRGARPRAPCASVAGDRSRRWPALSHRTVETARRLRRARPRPRLARRLRARRRRPRRRLLPSDPAGADRGRRGVGGLVRCPGRPAAAMAADGCASGQPGGGRRSAGCLGCTQGWLGPDGFHTDIEELVARAGLPPVPESRSTEAFQQWLDANGFRRVWLGLLGERLVDVEVRETALLSLLSLSALAGAAVLVRERAAR